MGASAASAGLAALALPTWVNFTTATREHSLAVREVMFFFVLVAFPRAGHGATTEW